jgi:hypothetical protein
MPGTRHPDNVALREVLRQIGAAPPDARGCRPLSAEPVIYYRKMDSRETAF